MHVGASTQMHTFAVLELAHTENYLVILLFYICYVRNSSISYLFVILLFEVLVVLPEYVGDRYSIP